jgi:N-acetylglucosamine-6-sulfatase
MGGDHAMLEKRSFYEEASRVPLLIRAPFVDGQPRTIGGNIGQVDLVPTLLELLEQPVPEDLQGRSRAKVLEGNNTLGDNDVFVQWNGAGDRDLGNEAINRLSAMPRRSVITGDRWKLNLCATDQGELFDLGSDPHETTNLFDAPEHRDRIRDMAARIRQWQVETGDDAPLPAL